MTMLKIEPVSWQDDAEILTAIRHRVFVDEQHVPIELEIDEHDPQAQHWLASLGDTAVGTVRLLSDGHIGRMAVLADYRGKHIGQDMLDTVIASAKAQQFPLLRLAAQQHAIGFYRKAGWNCDWTRLQKVPLSIKTSPLWRWIFVSRPGAKCAYSVSV